MRGRRAAEADDVAAASNNKSRRSPKAKKPREHDKTCAPLARPMANDQHIHARTLQLRSFTYTLAPLLLTCRRRRAGIFALPACLFVVLCAALGFPSPCSCLPLHIRPNFETIPAALVLPGFAWRCRCDRDASCLTQFASFAALPRLRCLRACHQPVDEIALCRLQSALRAVQSTQSQGARKAGEASSDATWIWVHLILPLSVRAGRCRCA